MRLIMVTIPKEKAEIMGRTLVDERLAACANLIPAVHSIYQWQGSVEEAEETLILLKTTDEAVPSLTERIKALHPYEVPEIVSLDIRSDEGNFDYLKWVRESVR